MPMDTVALRVQWKILITEAKRQESLKQKRFYVAWSVPDGKYYVTDRMPLLGEWYDADGIRHG